MNILKKFLAPWLTPPAIPTKEPAKAKINWKELLDAARAAAERPVPPTFERYEPAPGVVNDAQKHVVRANDATPYDYLNSASVYGLTYESFFPGYPYLAQLAQLPEYRKMSGVIAEEMTRKWIKLQVTGDGDFTDKVAQIDSALKKHKVRDKFRQMAEHDGFFGRGQIYIDVTKAGGTAASQDATELAMKLDLSPTKIKKGSLRGFRVVEPMWTYPGAYNSTDPLDADYYRPSTWYTMGKIVHDSRYLMMISRPVPDALKAAYSFGGVSLSQLARPYVDNWIRTRDSVSDLVHSFSMSGLATDLETILSPDYTGSGDLVARAMFFNQLRDNRGLMMLNKATEEFFQFNTPLGGLDHLQAQAQEQMCSVSSIPLVKFTGITPSGLNADSDGEIRVFYDDIHARQENAFRDPLTRVIQVIQLDLFGEVYPEIGFEFEPLFQLSSLEKANERKIDAETDAVLIDASIITNMEARTRVASDPDSPYASLENIDEDPAAGENDGEEGDESSSADTERQGSSAGSA